MMAPRWLKDDAPVGGFPGNPGFQGREGGKQIFKMTDMVMKKYYVCMYVNIFHGPAVIMVQGFLVDTTQKWTWQ